MILSACLYQKLQWKTNQKFFLHDIYKLWIFIRTKNHVNMEMSLDSLITIITELIIHSKTILENTVEIEPQPVALHFKNLSQYSSRSK